MNILDNIHRAFGEEKVPCKTSYTGSVIGWRRIPYQYLLPASQPCSQQDNQPHPHPLNTKLWHPDSMPGCVCACLLALCHTTALWHHAYQVRDTAFAYSKDVTRSVSQTTLLKTDINAFLSLMLFIVTVPLLPLIPFTGFSHFVFQYLWSYLLFSIIYIKLVMSSNNYTY